MARRGGPIGVRVERHPLGPRLFVAGVRIHEWQLGAAMLVAGFALPAMRSSLVGLGVSAVGLWLLVKDWNDLFPSRRDRVAWRLAPHREPLPLRPAHRADWLPSVAGVLAGLVGLLTVASALTPVGRWASVLTPYPHGRAHLLMQLLPEAIPSVAHAFALPAGAALLVLGHGLAQRRRRAWGLAVLVLVVAGALNLLKGLDLAEAAACWALAGALAAARPAFYVDPQTGPAAALRGAALVVGSSLAVAVATLFSASHWATPSTTWSRALEEIVARAAWASGPLHYRDPFDWVPAGIDLILLGALIGVAYVVFRPLAHSREFPGAAARELAAAIVRRHGRDTLSSFKLRPDKHYLFGADGRTFVGYAIEGRTLVVSGDPVGPPDAIPGLIRELCAFCELRGLRLASVGASGEFAQMARQAGLRSFYIGDEAMIDNESFSLEGRRIRKVRQAVARVERAGFRARLLDLEELDPETVDRLEALAERWRGDKVERGFSMASDGLRGELARQSVLLLATDSSDAPRGLLHFVPCYGRAAASLGLMRRDRDGPNGLTEFMVVRALELMRERGIREVSLNFAPFARLIHGPETRHERLLGRIAVAADRFFQVERLYRFNAKFQPRWEPRYLLYEGRLGLAAAGLAVMWAERQLPKPRLSRRPA